MCSEIVIVKPVVQGSSSITADFSTQVTRIRALSFNAVKLPFAFSQLLGSALAPVSTACTTATAAQLQVGTCLAKHMPCRLPCSIPLSLG